jgi:oligoribonuclease (3'-5' exoribonuclease)
MAKLLYLHCETSGIDLKTSNAYEISGIFEEDGAVKAAFAYSMQLPNDDVNFEGFLTDEKLDKIDNYSERKEVADKLLVKLQKFVTSKEEKLVIVGYKAEFHMNFLLKFLKEFKIKSYEYFTYEYIDLKQFATLAKFGGILEYKSTKFKDVLDAIGVELGKGSCSKKVLCSRKLFQWLDEKVHFCPF